MIDVVTDQNNFIEQMNQKLTIIKIEKKRAYLKHRLIQIKAKKNDFLQLFSRYRNRFEKMSNFKQFYHSKRI